MVEIRHLDEPLIDLTVAAELISMSPNTLRLWAHRRKIRSYLIGKRLRFKRSDLEALVTERKKQA